jgi:hypothetical protein
MPTYILKHILLSLFIFASLILYAQTPKDPTPKESKTKTPAPKKLSKKQFVKDSIEIMKMKQVRPQLRVDNRMTYHKGQILNINGIDAGVLLKEKLRLTLGYYYLNDDLSAYKIDIDGQPATRTIKLQYGSINTEFIYLNTRYVSLGMPLDFGFGRNEVNFKNLATNQNFDGKHGFVFLTDFGLSAVFKPLRAIGIRGAIGYRKLILNPVRNFNFNGFFTSLGISVDFYEIIKDVRMFNLKKRYKRGNDLGNAVDLITD